MLCMASERVPRIGFVLLFGIVVASCASLGTRTEGVSGPIA